MRLLGLRGRGLFPLVAAVAVLIGAGNGLLGVCGPFTDVAADAFCPLVLEILTLGITTGTTATTYDPTSNVNRLQMAAFLSRSVDGVLKRGGRRAALGRYWNTQATGLSMTTVGSSPTFLRSDGADLWVSNSVSSTVSRVRASDGRLLETWVAAALPGPVLTAMGKVFISGDSNPAKLYEIDPGQPAGGVATVASNLGNNPQGLAFDGGRVWSANFGSPGSVSIITPGASLPWTVTTVTAGFQEAGGILYDGSNIWVTDLGAGTLLKLDAAGAILQTVTVGVSPAFPVYDGTNIWVPNRDTPSVTVIRASTGAVLATLTGNGLVHPLEAAFDGQRILITNYTGNTVSLWKAADLTSIGFIVLAGSPTGACGDGVDFWVALQASNKIVRF